MNFLKLHHQIWGGQHIPTMSQVDEVEVNSKCSIPATPLPHTYTPDTHKHTHQGHKNVFPVPCWLWVILRTDNTTVWPTTWPMDQWHDWWTNDTTDGPMTRQKDQRHDWWTNDNNFPIMHTPLNVWANDSNDRHNIWCCLNGSVWGIISTIVFCFPRWDL